MQLKRDDRGVTLVELLVAIVIMSVIAAPLAGGLFVFFRNTDEVTRRLSDSHDAQMLVNYFSQDVQAMGRRDWNAAGFPFVKSVETMVEWNQGTLQCGGSDLGTTVIRLAWDARSDDGAPTTGVIVAYAYKVVGTEKQLHRLVCTTSSTPDLDVVLVHNLDGMPVAPTCTPSPCTAAPGIPRFIDWVVKIRSPGSFSSTLDVNLRGQRRQM